MGALVRAKDWSQTPLGPVGSWPQSLKTALSIVLDSRFAMVVAWGPEFRFFYNDRYRPVLGATKHPLALGTPAKVIFPEAWPFIGPLFNKTRQGDSVALDDQLIPLDRNGYLEDCYFTLSYSPIRDESGSVGGMLAVVAETTARVEGERRLATLRDLLRAAGDVHKAETACENAARILDKNRIDVPFALLYLLDSDGSVARLASASGVDPHPTWAPTIIDARSDDAKGWPVSRALRARKLEVVCDVPERFGALAGGPYPEPTHTAVMVPLAKPGQENPYAILIAGVSPRRALDEPYHGFFELAADHILSAIGNARAFEEERRRAEALAEIDRAKTAFFNNVSHEFRTPLTLMLGPTEDLLSGVHGELTPEQRVQLELLRRNELRLQRLVNALLEFARIEAGRTQACYEPVDLATLTRELASSFQSAVERAGLKFTVQCAPIDEPVFVDRELWEQIVLNLLSNAFKFTFEGEISISLLAAEGCVVMRVTDTGVGVRKEHVPRLFERFHRVEGTRARTHEGSGIGLALVAELVRLHGGSIVAESEYGAGTSFTVTIPKGSSHLPQERIGVAKTSAPNPLRGVSFVEEALRWLPDAPIAVDPSTRHARILVADDNADMREYLRRILERQWEVETVPDGEAALAAARARRPDVILTDVMMPGLDGFALLRALRKDEATKGIPVVMLSARAGEEATIEGLEAGADDYLVKPFSARELLARVWTHLELARLRHEAQKKSEQQIEELQHSLALSQRFVGILGHDLRNPLGAIVTTSDLLLHRETSERIARPIQRIHRSAERMTRMIEQILDLTRARLGGGIPIVPAAMDLQALATQLVEELEGAAPQPMVLETLGDMQGEWDSDRLAQVLSNLLGNAVEHGDPKKPPRLKLDGTEPSVVRFSVWNSGAIPEELLPTLFDPFRGAPATARKSKGLGLGLYIVQQVIEAHGGNIELRSSAKDGTTFLVSLPRRATSSRPASALRAP